ncbi:MAG TPA: beta-propeller fold lactonase family protein [Steroidobacteraceae bacterium]|nr:beta-propeller fold lactonase family protein [Steroidobacteraceae bacterium]
MLLSRTRNVRLLGTGLLMGLIAGASAQAAPANSSPKVLQSWHLDGAGGWDYLTLDSTAQRLFVSHATRVDVVDTRSGKLVGTIADTNGVHGIALAEDLKRGYTSNGKADSVTMFDLDTLAVIKEAPVPGHNPDAILYEPVGKHLFTFNGRSKDVTVLDAANLTVVATLPVPDKPEFAVDDGKGHIYANIESEPGQMVVIDSKKLTITATWTLPGCASPSGIAMDKAHGRLFSVCDGKVMAVTDSATGKQIAKVKVGEGPDAVAYDAQRGLVFSSNGEGTLTVVRQESADHYRVAESVQTKRGARTMALDSASGKVYLVSADFGPLPAATPEQPHPRPVPIPGTFTVLVVGTP